MKLRGKARQRERARRRAAELQGAPLVMSQDRRQAMLRNRGGDLAVIVGREEECIEVLTQALELDPDDFRSRLGLSFVLLRLGQYERAWPHYREVMIEDGRDAPGWRGQSLRGCSVAMRVDPDHPALGDWIFGARYIRPLMERAAKVVVEVPTKLRSMAHNWSDVEVVHEGDPMPDIDYEVTAMFMLPEFKTTLNSIPPCPYITAPADRVEHWRQRLPRDGKRLVAIGWTGGGNPDARKLRSMPLASVKKILAAPDVQFVSVERFLPNDVIARLSQFNFIHVGDQVSDDMGELASVLSVCDHTISIDNSTAHLAGALGLPMSLMLTDGAAGGEWRWHCVGRDYAPWYPSARLFRRTEQGDWSDVVEQVCTGLAGTLRAAA